MTQGLIVAISDDRRRRLAAFRWPDGLYVLHDQRLIDPEAAPQARGPMAHPGGLTRLPPIAVPGPGA